MVSKHLSDLWKILGCGRGFCYHTYSQSKIYRTRGASKETVHRSFLQFLVEYPWDKIFTQSRKQQYTPVWAAANKRRAEGLEDHQHSVVEALYEVDLRLSERKSKGFIPFLYTQLSHTEPPTMEVVKIHTSFPVKFLLYLALKLTVPLHTMGCRRMIGHSWRVQWGRLKGKVDQHWWP